MTLRVAHLSRVSIAPDGAFAKQVMRSEPRSGEHDGRPPRIPCEHDGRGESAYHFDHAVGDKVHRNRHGRAGDAEIEIARHAEIAGELRIFEMAHTGRAQARGSEAIVEPCRSSVAEIRAGCLMHRRKNLQQHENRAGERERKGEAGSVFHGRHQRAHGDREQRGQRSAKDQQRPPEDRKRTIGARKNAGEFPQFVRAPAADDTFHAGHSVIIPR